MVETVIDVQELGKRYRLGETVRTGRQLLAETLQRAFFNLAKDILTRTSKNEEESHIWALHNISFQVKKGEVLGLIGRNGAGKSTLLKILSRITEPTEGMARLIGRIGTLLEVGIGFHPELTGRENIFLNGAILGMKKREITAKFEEIAAFAEIERFLDTPVKRYSSGMYMRLAFSVAAHLETEILLVDEVLAVGDAAFQKKCLGKMSEVAQGGKTVVFVSHNMAAVRQLCHRVIVLAQGELLKDEKPDKAVELYLNLTQNQEQGARQWDKDPFVKAGKAVFPISLALKNSDDTIVTTMGFDQSVQAEITVQVAASLSFQVSVIVTNSMGLKIFSNEATADACRYEEGLYRFQAHLPPSLLAPGVYYLGIAIYYPNGEFFFFDDAALSFSIEETGSAVAKYQGGYLGVIVTNLKWSIARLS